MAKTVEELEKIIDKYEEDGPAKLYYSLRRKTNEMADLLNSVNLKNIPLEDPKDKTFERMKTIWNDSANLASAVVALGITAGVTGDETKDTSKRTSFLSTIADNRT